MSKERYENLDGLRALSCLGIIAMHIKANTDYRIAGWFYRTFVSSCTYFVHLFLLISGFGMFCGYYQRFREGNADLNSFYKKRYEKILPFFATLILLEILVERSPASVIEGLTEMTLVFGLLPNNELQVIGVGWTLGLIFLFYLLFPFFVWLCWTKKRAWFSFAVSIVLNIFCGAYFFTDRFVVSTFSYRHCFLYCAPFFLGGGLVYLYRKPIRDLVTRYRWLCLGVCAGITLVFYRLLIPGSDPNRPGFIMLALFLPWLCCAIGPESRLLSNKVTRFLSSISLECYLGHMMFFQVADKAGCLYLFGDGFFSFLFVFAFVLTGLIVFIGVWKRLWHLVCRKARNVR